jgi:hypothetical protein
MEGNQKPRKDSRIPALFRRKKPASTSPAQTSSSQSSQGSPTQSMESADTQKTRNRYNDAIKFLQDTIEAHGSERWRELRLYKFGGEMEDFHDSQLRDQIDEALKILNISIEDQSILGKCRHIILCMFTALSPLAKNFLTVAMTGSNVLFFITLMTSV